MKNGRVLKRLIYIIFSVLLLTTQVANVYAAETAVPEQEWTQTVVFDIEVDEEGGIEIQPFNLNIKSSTISLSISSKTATVVTSITGYSNVTSISARVNLQRAGVTQSYKDNSKSGSSAVFTNTFTLSQSGKYQAYVNMTAKSSAGSETLNKYSNSVTY